MTGLASNVAQYGRVLSRLSRSGLRFGLRCRFWQELFEVFQQIGSRVKEMSHLSVDVLDGLGFTLISLQYLQKLLVDVGLIGEAVLSITSQYGPREKIQAR